VHPGVVVEIDWFIHSKDLIEISKISRLVNVACWFSIESLVIFGLATASEITCHFAIGWPCRGFSTVLHKALSGAVRVLSRR
jgi:hypothetical protein